MFSIGIDNLNSVGILQLLVSGNLQHVRMHTFCYMYMFLQDLTEAAKLRDQSGGKY